MNSLVQAISRRSRGRLRANMLNALSMFGGAALFLFMIFCAQLYLMRRIEQGSLFSPSAQFFLDEFKESNRQLPLIARPRTRISGPFR